VDQFVEKQRYLFGAALTLALAAVLACDDRGQPRAQPGASASPHADQTHAPTSATRPYAASRSREDEAMPATTPELEALRRKYAGKIKPGIDPKHWREHRDAMQQLLAEWNPVDRTVGELEFVLGPPPAREGERLHYWFENGRTGTGWTFVVRDGRIAEVERWAVN
jgi:hypothetical protein